MELDDGGVVDAPDDGGGVDEPDGGGHGDDDGGGHGDDNGGRFVVDRHGEAGAGGGHGVDDDICQKYVFIASFNWKIQFRSTQIKKK